MHQDDWLVLVSSIVSMTVSISSFLLAFSGDIGVEKKFIIPFKIAIIMLRIVLKPYGSAL
jgi:hypothetical protein